MIALLMTTDLWDMVLNGIVDKWYFFLAFVVVGYLAGRARKRK